ncbi:MAG: FAD-dependent oxidoreductase [Rhodospirillaceae bacterium]|nr:FAD-dependent oxidoreductase [Rhodospirillaceae bacterium]
MTKSTAGPLRTDICVIGAGAAGLSVAAGCVQLGARTVLIERGAMGGDCLNTGCVPSKAMLAAGHAAETMRTAGRYGIAGTAPVIDFAAVHRHVHGAIAAIAPMDSVERFEMLGVTVIRGAARFIAPDALDVDGRRITARRFVIATGSKAVAPPVSGLAEAPYLTNETIFNLTECPQHLLIMGGGPIGCEMAQAHRRLGARVTLVERMRLLGRDDEEAADVVRQQLLGEKIEILEGAKVERVNVRNGAIALTVNRNDAKMVLTGSHLLVAAGRAPVIDGLDLEKAGVAVGQAGIEVDAGLRTSNRRIFVAGDVAGGPQFTHVAGYHAGVLVRRLLFRMAWAKTDYRALPWVTYTEPELAQVGLTEAMAAERYRSLSILRWDFTENDRAQAERRTEGHMKVIATPRGRILGATIVGAHAGELIHPWVLAIQNGLSLAKMSSYIAPYPTFGEIGKRAASSYYTPKLFSARTRRIIRLLRYLP